MTFNSYNLSLNIKMYLFSNIKAMIITCSSFYFIFNNCLITK